MCERAALANTMPSPISPASAIILLRSVASTIGGSSPTRVVGAQLGDERADVAERRARLHAHALERRARATRRCRTEAAARELVHEGGALGEIADRARVDGRDRGAERDALGRRAPAPRTATCRRSLGA